MSLLHYLKMPFSFAEDWNKLGAIHPSTWKTFFLLTLPFSFIPPLMLVYMGSHQTVLSWMTTSSERWQIVASAFLMTELLTVPLMGWAIKNIAAAHNIPAHFKDTFRLATVAAIPMWLSSLGLFIPNLWIMAGIVLLGLFFATRMLYLGSFSILHINEPVEAQSLSYQVFSLGAILWVLLCAFVVLPLMN